MGSDKCNALRRLVYRFMPQKLQLLDDENVAWLPRLRSIHPADVAQSILLAVRAFETEADRLRATAWIRCWLLPLEDQRKWTFYRVTEIPTLPGCNEALSRITFALKQFTENASEPSHACIVRGSAFYACMLAKIKVNHVEEPQALYVSMWTTQPVFAVSCASKIHRRFKQAVQFAMRSDVFSIGEIRGSPEVAFKTALSTLSMFSVEAEGQRNPTADHQPPESLAVGSHGEQLSSGLGAT
ncbi:hypothetical protein V5799_028753, partial [Amblyomma americanum]